MTIPRSDRCLPARLALACLLLAPLPAVAQAAPEAAPAAEEGIERAPPPKPRPRPRPPLRRSTFGDVPKGGGKPAAESGLRGGSLAESPGAPSPREAAGEGTPSAPELRKAEDHPAAAPPSPSQGAFAAPPDAPAAVPKPEGPQVPQSPQGPLAAPVVACEPGQAVLFEAEGGFSFWVTRAGRVTIDNPLRPLTPDVTQVLQLVIAGRLATAYGPNLAVLRRGAAPGALEGLLGGPIRWDAALGTLPDRLDIVSDANAPLAQMRFRECGTAPATRAPTPLANARAKGRERRAVTGSAPASGGERPGVSGGGAEPRAGGGAGMPAARSSPAAQPRLTLPQGAIPE